MDICTEGAKEVVLGGLVGLTVGFIARRSGTHVIGALMGGAFVLLRAGVYEGELEVAWSWPGAGLERGGKWRRREVE